MIVPIVVAIGVVVGVYSPIFGFGIFGPMLLLAWIYFDGKKRRKIQKSPNANDGE